MGKKITRVINHIICFFTGHMYVTKDVNVIIDNKKIAIKQCIICGKLKANE